MQTVKTENGILEKAIGALRKHVSVQIENRRFNSRGDEPDYNLTLRTSDKARKGQSYRAEVKSTVGNATLGEVAIRAKQTPEKIVLVAEYITQPQAEKLREMGVSFFDTAGNAYFNEPGLYIFISGKKLKSGKSRVPRLFRPPGMKILFAFLTNPGLETAIYRDISIETNVPTPTVGLFMNDLERAGYIVRRSAGERFVVSKNDLLKHWVTAYGERFRVTLNPFRFRSKKYEGRWREDVEIAKYDACWGGENGGARLYGRVLIWGFNEQKETSTELTLVL